MSRDELFNLLSVVALFLPFIDWLAVVILTRAVRRRGLVTLKDRLAVALGIAGLTSLLAFLALSRFGHIAVSGDVIGVLLVAIGVFLSMVNLAFCFRYWRYAL